MWVCPLTALNYSHKNKLLILISAGRHSDWSTMLEFTISSCIWGCHVYWVIRTAILDEQSICKCEIGNAMDWYAVAAKMPVVYFLAKSQYGNMASHGYAIYILYSRFVALAMKWCILKNNTESPMEFDDANSNKHEIKILTSIWYNDFGIPYRGKLWWWKNFGKWPFIRKIFTIKIYIITLYSAIIRHQWILCVLVKSTVMDNCPTKVVL